MQKIITLPIPVLLFPKTHAKSVGTDVSSLWHNYDSLINYSGLLRLEYYLSCCVGGSHCKSHDPDIG